MTPGRARGLDHQVDAFERARRRQRPRQRPRDRGQTVRGRARWQPWGGRDRTAPPRAAARRRQPDRTRRRPAALATLRGPLRRTSAGARSLVYTGPASVLAQDRSEALSLWFPL